MASESVAMSPNDPSNTLAEICLLHCEMEAMAGAMQDALGSAAGDKRMRDRAYHLSMALQRSIREVGHLAGAC